MNKCDNPPCSLPHGRRRISEAIFITACSMHDHDEENRTEFICTHAAVTLKRILRSTFRTIEAVYTDRHEASRDLFAAAELFVPPLFVADSPPRAILLLLPNIPRIGYLLSYLQEQLCRNS